MLIIEIALGIVLGWILINHLDAILNSTIGLITVFFNVISYPFKITWKILKEIWLIAFELIYGVSVALLKSSLYVFPIAIFLVIVGGIFYSIFEFVPQPYSRYLFFSIFGGSLLYGIYVILRDSYLNYKNNDSKLWIYGALVASVLSIFIVVSAVRGMVSIFS